MTTHNIWTHDIYELACSGLYCCNCCLRCTDLWVLTSIWHVDSSLTSSRWEACSLWALRWSHPPSLDRKLPLSFLTKPWFCRTSYCFSLKSEEIRMTKLLKLYQHLFHMLSITTENTVTHSLVCKINSTVMHLQWNTLSYSIINVKKYTAFWKYNHKTTILYVL